MKYRPVGELQETIVTGAEFTPDSALLFMSMLEEYSEIQEELQEARENEFLNGEYAMDITVQDIVEDSILTEEHLDEMDARNCGTWKTTIEDTYRWREARSPERPLGRVESISENANISERRSLKFSTKDVRVTSIDGDEAIEIHFCKDYSLVLFVNTNNMEFYDGMYHPPVSMSLDTLQGRVDNFKYLSIRNLSDAAIKVMSSVKDDSINRELTKTEVILKNDLYESAYIPEGEVIDENREKLEEDILRLEKAANMSEDEARTVVTETLEQEYLLSADKLRLFELIRGKKRSYVSYSYIANPYYLQQVASLLNKEITSVPQEKILVLTDERPPDWIKELDEDFPEKNRLSEQEIDKLYSYIGVPKFVDMNQPWRDFLKSKEIVLQLFEESQITLDDTVSYNLNPWEDGIKPSKSYVLDAIEYGHKLREDLRSTDNKYDTNLYNKTLIWEKRDIFRKSNHPRD